MNIKYFSTLKFIFIKATNDIFPNSKIKILHSQNNGVLGEIISKDKITEEDVQMIKERMSV
jgi:uridine kinase